MYSNRDCKKLVWKNPIWAKITDFFYLLCPKPFENLVREGLYGSHLFPKMCNIYGFTMDFWIGIRFLDLTMDFWIHYGFFQVYSWHLICASLDIRHWHELSTWQCTDVHGLKRDKWNRCFACCTWHCNGHAQGCCALEKRPSDFLEALKV